MTEPPGDGGYLTVEQVARLRQVTPAAVRAQLRSGSLSGEQVLQGQRTVWRIPASAVRGRPEAPRPASPVPAPSVPPESPRSAPAASAPAASARVVALEAEVRRLRRQVAALAEAHRLLIDAVTADVADHGAH